MKRTLSTFALAGALVVGGLPSLAADPYPEVHVTHPDAYVTVESQKARLEAIDDEFERGSLGVKVHGMDQAKRAQLDEDIDELMDRVEAGQRVPSGEIDMLVVRMRGGTEGTVYHYHRL